MHVPKLLALVVAVSLASGCVARPPRIGDGATDRKLTLTSFIEEGSLATLIVSTKLTRIRSERDYIPVEIAVVNRGLPNLTLSAESFILIDEEGKRYPAVGRAELARGYGNVDVDRRLADLAPVARGKYNSYIRAPSTFTPSFDKPIARTSRLPRFQYVVDFLYFPKPSTGVRGHRFELFMSAPELDDPVFVKFEVDASSKKR